jgi:hypothetical protein
VLLAFLVLGMGGIGWNGYNTGWGPAHYGGSGIGFILLIVVVVLLFR